MPTSPPYVSAAKVNEIEREQPEIVSEGLCTNGFYGGRNLGQLGALWLYVPTKARKAFTMWRQAEGVEAARRSAA